MEAYADYLGTTEGLLGTFATGGDEAEQQEALVKVFVSRARVLLVYENPEVEKPAGNLSSCAD
jgi:hypothetical protein